MGVLNSYLVLVFHGYHVDFINILSNFEDGNTKKDSNYECYSCDGAVTLLKNKFFLNGFLIKN